LIEVHEKLKSYIKNYNKGLFGSREESSFSLDETQLADIPQVSIVENNLLTAPYSEEEVNKAIFQMKHNKSHRMFPTIVLSDLLGNYQGGASTDVWCFTRWTVRIISSKFR
jgi:hypothetical protein